MGKDQFPIPPAIAFKFPVTLEVIKTIGHQLARLGIHAPHGGGLVSVGESVPVFIHQPAAVQRQGKSKVRGDPGPIGKSPLAAPFADEKIQQGSVRASGLHLFNG